jgi:hypothetical protein
VEYDRFLEGKNKIYNVGKQSVKENKKNEFMEKFRRLLCGLGIGQIMLASLLCWCIEIKETEIL